MSDLRAPFPYFGGKSRVAHLVWQRFGDVSNYVEPFFGSGAVLLSRPAHHSPSAETINDADCYVANFWRATVNDPDAVAQHADWPVNEVDLHARHQWLVDQAEFRERMVTDPTFYDVRIAGWWVWGLCAWIGGGWCDVSRSTVARKRPVMMAGGRGVHSARLSRRRPHLTDAGMGVHRQLPNLSGDSGAYGRGIHAKRADPCRAWFRALRDRLRRVRVCCGDWSRITGPAVLRIGSTTGVFLDPPYADTAGRAEVYAAESLTVAHDVREWAIEHGGDPRLRIALCGYEGEHEMPDSWECVAWKANGGYGSRGTRGSANRHRERIWFSPACIRRHQRKLWAVPTQTQEEAQ